MKPRAVRSGELWPIGQVPPAAGAESAFDRRFDGELWLARRLKKFHVDPFVGVTDETARKTRFREAIKAHGLEAVIIGTDRSGPKAKCVTFSAAFRRLYGEPL
jgi:hypothetical protein